MATSVSEAARLSGSIAQPTALHGTLEKRQALSGSVAIAATVPADPAIDAESTRPVQNRAVAAALEAKVDKASSMTTDDILGIFHS